MLTKAVIERLKLSDVSVRLFNGCFNVAVATATFSRHTFELRVEVTHPALVWQCGDKREVSLIKWVGSNGLHVDIPADLNDLIDEMRFIASMTDEEAQQVSASNQAAFDRAAREMGFSAASV